MAAATPAAAAAAKSVALQLPAVVQSSAARLKHAQLLDILALLPRWGQGCRVTRSIWAHWGAENCFWTVTRVLPNQVRGGGGDSARRSAACSPPLPSRFAQPESHDAPVRRGRIWGVFTWRGVSEGKERRVRSRYKRQWSLVADARGNEHR